MRSNSTLVYFINYFQNDLNKIHLDNSDAEIESILTVMENAGIAPSNQCVEKILDFARSYEVLETENAGYVEMMLN